MNAPLNYVFSNAPPREDAIMLASAIVAQNGGVFARAGDAIYFDLANGRAINARTGEHTPARPLEMARARTGYEFGGSPPAPADVHYPTVLTAWLQAYTNAAYLLPTLVQEQPVDRSDFLHRDHSSTNTFVVTDTNASQLSSPPLVQADTALTTRKTSPRRVGTLIPWLTEQEADFPYVLSATRVLGNVMHLSREHDAFKSGGLFMTSGNWASAVRLALGGTDNWGPKGSEGNTSDPIRDLRNAVKASLGDITHWGMSLQTSFNFFSHPSTIDHFKAYDGLLKGILERIRTNADATILESPTTFTVPTIPGLFYVHQARATTDPATAPDYFWPDDIVLGFRHSPSMPPNLETCTAVSFIHRSPSNGSANPLPGMSSNAPQTTGGTLVRMFQMDAIGAGCRMIVADRSELTAFTSNNVGAYITGVT